MRGLRDNSLTLALTLLCTASLLGQVFTGWASANEARLEHAQAPLALLAYLGGGDFLSALFENWESEFLQMWVFVMLTAYLFQRGSPESKDPDRPAPQDGDPAEGADAADAPGPARAGGLVRTVYSHSLGLALLGLFLVSFALHAVNSTRKAGEDAVQHGRPPPTVMSHLTAGDFWFESFQNWQSEFLSTAVLIVLGVVLRERKSPVSKPVAAPHAKTGD